MVPAIVDLAGLNRISRGVLARAAGAICGMVEASRRDDHDDRPLVVASMFGNTTRASRLAKQHRRRGRIRGARLSRHRQRRPHDGIADRRGAWSPACWISRRRNGPTKSVGGVMSARADAVEAAAALACRRSLLRVAWTWSTSGARTVPAQYRDRKLYQHNPNVTLMRTNVEENTRLAGVDCRQAECESRTSDRALAAPRAEHDRQARRAVSLAGGGPGADSTGLNRNCRGDRSDRA